MYRRKKYKEGEWHEGFPSWLAKELAEVRQSDDPEKFVFDVVTVEESKRMEEAEEEARLLGTKTQFAHKYVESQHHGATEASSTPPVDEAAGPKSVEDETHDANEETLHNQPQPDSRESSKPKRRPRRGKTRRLPDQ